MDSQVIVSCLPRGFSIEDLRQKFHTAERPVVDISRQTTSTALLTFSCQRDARHAINTQTDKKLKVRLYSIFFGEKFFGCKFNITKTYVEVKAGTTAVNKLLSDTNCLNEVTKCMNSESKRFWIQLPDTVGSTFLRQTFPEDAGLHFGEISWARFFKIAFEKHRSFLHTIINRQLGMKGRASVLEYIIPVKTVQRKFLKQTKAWRAQFTDTEVTDNNMINIRSSASEDAAHEARDKLIHFMVGIAEVQVPVSKALAKVFGTKETKSAIQEMLVKRKSECFWELDGNMITIVAPKTELAGIRQIFETMFVERKIPLTDHQYQLLQSDETRRFLLEQFLPNSESEATLAPLIDCDSNVMIVVHYACRIDDTVAAVKRRLDEMSRESSPVAKTVKRKLRSGEQSTSIDIDSAIELDEDSLLDFEIVNETIDQFPETGDSSALPINEGIASEKEEVAAQAIQSKSQKNASYGKSRDLDGKCSQPITVERKQESANLKPIRTFYSEKSAAKSVQSKPALQGKGDNKNERPTTERKSQTVEACKDGSSNLGVAEQSLDHGHVATEAQLHADATNGKMPELGAVGGEVSGGSKGHHERNKEPFGETQRKHLMGEDDQSILKISSNVTNNKTRQLSDLTNDQLLTVAKHLGMSDSLLANLKTRFPDAYHFRQTLIDRCVNMSEPERLWSALLHLIRDASSVSREPASKAKGEEQVPGAGDMSEPTACKQTCSNKYAPNETPRQSAGPMANQNAIPDYWPRSTEFCTTPTPSGTFPSSFICPSFRPSNSHGSFDHRYVGRAMPWQAAWQNSANVPGQSWVNVQQPPSATLRFAPNMPPSSNPQQPPAKSTEPNLDERQTQINGDLPSEAHATKNGMSAEQMWPAVQQEMQNTKEELKAVMLDQETYMRQAIAHAEAQMQHRLEYEFHTRLQNAMDTQAHMYTAQMRALETRLQAQVETVRANHIEMNVDVLVVNNNSETSSSVASPESNFNVQ